ncbi:MAG: UvrD-helicase domain-containing protein [Candidatus Methanomethylophilaceae archaeon]
MALNESQERIAATVDGMVVVDAGPGTGKTKTITERYLRILAKEDVSPNDILLLTFTNNAATEMSQRLKAALLKEGKVKESKQIQARTFDSFCLSIVMDSPDQISDFFGIRETLTHNVRMSTNSTLNRDYFLRFLDRFLSESGDMYGDHARIATGDPLAVMSTIDKLMARGIVPLSKGWFDRDGGRSVEGDIVEVGKRLKSLRNEGSLKDLIKKQDMDDYQAAPDIMVVSDEEISMAADGDRSGLFDFIHDVYYEFIRQSIRDNRLTFGLVSTFAFTVLYNDAHVRERNSFRYVMIDEFQDTNANQLMIALMILSEPNLCVVGDWKQGIYGFRYVSIENITEFESRVIALRRFLNDDGIRRVAFSVPETLRLPLDVNYRSTQEIIDTAYECLLMPATQNEVVKVPDITYITAGRTDIGDDRCIRYSQADDRDGEIAMTVAAIRDYVSSGNYIVHTDDGSRPMGYGDIAVIAGKNSQCVKIMEACTEEGIPAYLYGDVDIMSTREGKLALAWLRFVNNEADEWGYMPILADMGYTLEELERRKPDNGSPGGNRRFDLPSELLAQRSLLRNKRRRITELLTCIFEYYGLDNDITQAIISSISSLHRSSLLTVSDVIRIMEDDIDNGTSYDVERTVETDAVKIMTMHKSKGLEFPAVILPFIDRGTVPKPARDTSTFTYDPLLGIRCTKEVARYGDYTKICKSWRTRLAKKAAPIDYDEQRRLMFVAMSRAKQYETVICNRSSESPFFKHLSKDLITPIPEVLSDMEQDEGELIKRPDVPVAVRRRRTMAVHDLMDFGADTGQEPQPGCDEIGGKGRDYGDKVHKIAYQMLHGGTPKEKLPEIPHIQSILNGLDGADIRGEVDCGLPIPGTDITLRGKIDLIAVFPDRVEIHDYKTDATPRFRDLYTFQLSVYAQAAAMHYGLPVRCYIDYISTDLPPEKVEMWPMNLIIEHVVHGTSTIKCSENS